MIRPAEIRQKAERKYPAYLQAILRGEPFAQLEIPCDTRYSKTSLAEFEREVRQLMSMSREKLGYGYSIRYQRVKTRYLGEQELPVGIYFAAAADYERYLGKEAEVAQFRTWSARLLGEFEELKDWVLRYPLKVVQYAADWERIIGICRYFKANPRPGRYMRQLPLGVSTKYVEQHQALLRELLDILIAGHVAFEEKQFERRYGLRYSEPQLRFRILDEAIRQQYFSGLEDLAVPVSQLDRLRLPVVRVLVVENKTSLYTALTIPDIPKAMVIFGGGYGVQVLQGLRWLAQVETLLYWGDIDAHGFEILAQFRGYFPSVRSVLMDEGTFSAFFEGDAGVPTTEKAGLPLEETEWAMYRTVVRNHWRLEQEKIPQAYVEECLMRHLFPGRS